MMSRRVKWGSGITGAAAVIIAAVIGVEGGFVNNPSDPGGPTKYGITQAVARAHGYNGPMQALTVEQARAIYYADYIQKPGYAPILAQSPAVAQELVDSSVNVGPRRASEWLQRALNAFSNDGRAYPQVSVDGHVGRDTAAAFGALEQQRGPALACRLVIKLLDGQQAVYYMQLQSGGPFRVGWVRYRIGNVPLADCDKAAAP